MATWTRSSVEFNADPQGAYLPAVRPRILLRASAETGPLRLGVWAGDTLLVGWRVPFLPSNSFVIIDGGRATGIDGGVSRELRGWLRGYDDGLPSHFADLPHGMLTLTLDQDPALAVAVLVEVSTTQVAA